MPDTTVLEIAPRKELRKQNRGLRARGQVPGIIYGHRVDPVSVALPRREFERAFHKVGRTQLLDLKIDGEGGSRKVLVREVQYDPRANVVLHVDFYQVNLKEKITADVPVVLVGESPAVQRRDGELQQNVNSLRVSCLPADIPEHIEVDVSGLEAVDDSIRLWDLASGKVRKTFPTTEEHRTGRATFTPDGKTLASCGFASDVRLWDVENGLEKAALKTGGSDPKQMVAVSRDGRFLAAACDDGILKLWSLQDGKLLISWKGDDMDVDFVLFTPDARTLISNGILPPIIKLWDVAKWTRP